VITLDQIGIENGTDKASVFTRTYAKPHDYLRHMEKFFEPMRNEPIRLVEIGVGGGESIRTWLYYFLCAEVIGIDNVSVTNEWNLPRKFGEFGKDYTNDDLAAKYYSRYAFHAADQTDPVFWACFAADYGKTIDIAIDDGSHEPKAVQTSFEGLWPLVKPGGLYCIEDLACGFTNPGWLTHLEWFGTTAENVILGGGNGIDSIYFSKELCILRKK
jgi:demethylmacrocin O-methyltransferase